MVVYQPISTNKRVRSLPWFAARRVPSQKLPSHEDSSPEPGKIRVTEEKPRKTREEWVITIKDKMDKACGDITASRWDKLCIYRVPHYLQENDKKSYFPQTVSLGPYHHDKEHLLPMESHKWRAVNMVLKHSKKGIETYIDAMKNLEETASACYQGDICMSSDEFTEMLFLDGCFVLELFRGTDEGFTKIGYAPKDPVFAMGGLMHSIQRDMVMLENQLPLFVLDKLLELQLGTVYQPGLVAKLAVKFFDLLMPKDETKSDKNSDHSVRDIGGLHCLDVFRRSLFKSTWEPDQQSPKSKSSRKQQLIHCVTELKEAGVKFQRNQTDKLLDIEFNKKGYLKIPKLLIHDGTKCLFSNLIAFEQCHACSSNNMTSYIIFMDNLINSAEDVSHLHQCGIIEHWLGSDFEVADLFNRLCKEVVFDPVDSYLSQRSGEVNDYYYNKWNYLKATLRHRYFSNPWAYFSFSAALFLLILTLLQSFFAMYAYYKPSS